MIEDISRTFTIQKEITERVLVEYQLRQFYVHEPFEEIVLRMVANGYEIHGSPFVYNGLLTQVFLKYEMQKKIVDVEIYL